MHLVPERENALAPPSVRNKMSSIWLLLRLDLSDFLIKRKTEILTVHVTVILHLNSRSKRMRRQTVEEALRF